MKVIELAPNLLLSGLGGSIQDKEEDANGKIQNCWAPFPYSEPGHDAFNKDLDQLWAKTTEKWSSMSPNTKIILMTHEGPFGSSTCKNDYKVFKDGGSIFHTGSPHLMKLITSNADKVILNLHGHSHDGSFYQNLQEPGTPLPVINPGSLTQSEFGELVIGKKNGNWKVVQANKIFL